MFPASEPLVFAVSITAYIVYYTAIWGKDKGAERLTEQSAVSFQLIAIITLL
jgi:hypothetical protein